MSADGRTLATTTLTAVGFAANRQLVRSAGHVKPQNQSRPSSFDDFVLPSALTGLTMIGNLSAGMHSSRKIVQNVVIIVMFSIVVKHKK